MSSLPAEAYPDLLRSLRAARSREAFLATCEDFARLHPARSLRHCLPRVDAATAAALQALEPLHLRLRPCYGQPGATLTLRSAEGLRALVALGPRLGPGLVRLVLTPGVGQEDLPALLRALPAGQLAALRLDGQAITARRPVITRGEGNLLRLHIAGDDALIATICALPALRELSLADNRIGPAGARALARLPGLRRLDLRGNALGDEGAAALAAAEGLEDLRLEDNCVGPAGALALLDLPRLRRLDLRRNPIGARAAEALAGKPGLERLLIDDAASPPAPRPRVLKIS